MRGIIRGPTGIARSVARGRWPTQKQETCDKCVAEKCSTESCPITYTNYPHGYWGSCYVTCHGDLVCHHSVLLAYMFPLLVYLIHNQRTISVPFSNFRVPSPQLAYHQCTFFRFQHTLLQNQCIISVPLVDHQCPFSRNPLSPNGNGRISTPMSSQKLRIWGSAVSSEIQLLGVTEEDPGRRLWTQKD